jgi:hypothetical protein
MWFITHVQHSRLWASSFWGFATRRNFPTSDRAHLVVNKRRGREGEGRCTCSFFPFSRFPQSAPMSSDWRGSFVSVQDLDELEAGRMIPPSTLVSRCATGTERVPSNAGYSPTFSHGGWEFLLTPSSESCWPGTGFNCTTYLPTACASKVASPGVPIFVGALLVPIWWAHDDACSPSLGA